MVWLLRQKSANVKWIRSDNTGEYTGKEFQDICAKSGIIHETTSPHTPEHNGIAERYNRTLQEGTLTLWHNAGLSGRFWVSAIHTVNFIKNCILHSCLSISPYQAFWGMKPKVDWLHIYGSKCWALIPKSTHLKTNINLSKVYSLVTTTIRKHTKYGYPERAQSSRPEMQYSMSTIILSE